MKICIVGGGTAGYVTALILNKRLNCKIEMIVPSNIGIIGVGEGSTEHWSDFIRFIDESPVEVLRQTQGTIKSGIYFKDWVAKDYLHSLHSAFTQKIGMTSLIMNELMSQECNPLDTTHPTIQENKLNKELEAGGYAQFHFNTFKLNEYLHNCALKRNITIYDDEVVNVNFTENKDIESVTGNKNTYKADYFIDSTGFHRVLMKHLNTNWVSYSEYLPLKEAIAFPTKDMNDYNIYTEAQAMDAGWMWKIPVYGRTGNGYIYDSDFINKEQAIKEVEKKLGHKIEVAKHIRFNPGRLDKVWVKNCVAVGLSANFLEPLEATSIGTTIQQAFILMHRLTPTASQRERDDYNEIIKDIMENSRDFVALHYITDRQDTDFWKMCFKLPKPKALREFLDIWKERPLDTLDILKYYKNSYNLFWSDNFNQIAYAHGLLKAKVVKNFTESINKDIRYFVWNNKENFNGIYIKHKDYIKSLHE